MIDDQERRDGDDALWAAARERTREQVRAVFAGTVTPTRKCPHCGAETQTRYEHCPACGESYLTTPPRFSRPVRLLFAATGAVVAAGAAVALALVLFHQGANTQRDVRARRAAAVAAERRRLTREQTPHHAPAGIAPARPSASASERRRIRRAMVGALEAAITADARSRVPRGELHPARVLVTECGPLNGRTADEDDLRKRLGRYACEAVTRRVRGTGGLRISLGIPFVGVIDFTRGTLTWCKDNPVGAGDVKLPLAVVRLKRECTAARGPAFGSGYLVEPVGH